MKKILISLVFVVLFCSVSFGQTRFDQNTIDIFSRNLDNANWAFAGKAEKYIAFIDIDPPEIYNKKGTNIINIKVVNDKSLVVRYYVIGANCDSDIYFTLAVFKQIVQTREWILLYSWDYSGPFGRLSESELFRKVVDTKCHR